MEQLVREERKEGRKARKKKEAEIVQGQFFYMLQAVTCFVAAFTVTRFISKQNNGGAAALGECFRLPLSVENCLPNFTP